MDIKLVKLFDIRKNKAGVILRSGRENDLGVLTITDGMRVKHVRCDIGVFGPCNIGSKKREDLAADAVAQACCIEVALIRGKYTSCLINENADDLTRRNRNFASGVGPVLLRGHRIQAWLNVHDRNIARVMQQAVKQDGLFSLRCSLTFSGPAYKERRIRA